MQAITTRRTTTNSIAMLAIVGILAAAALVVATMSLAGNISRGEQSVPAAAIQRSSDAAFTTESEQAIANAARAQAAARQMTSDTAYVLEAAQVAQQAAPRVVASGAPYGLEAQQAAALRAHLAYLSTPSAERGVGGLG